MLVAFWFSSVFSWMDTCIANWDTSSAGYCPLFMTRTLKHPNAMGNKFYFSLVTVVFVVITPPLAESAPNYLRKLRVKSRQRVIYFTSIEVATNRKPKAKKKV